MPDTTTTYPRRIFGVLAEDTGETAFCRNCLSQQPTAKTIAVIAGNQRASIWCSRCEKYLSGYTIEKPVAKKEEGQSDPPSPQASARHSRNTPLTDADMMPFGLKHGPRSNDPRKLGDVPADYLLWIGEQSWIGDWPALKTYIETNRTRLEKESER